MSFRCNRSVGSSDLYLVRGLSFLIVRSFVFVY